MLQTSKNGNVREGWVSDETRSKEHTPVHTQDTDEREIIYLAELLVSSLKIKVLKRARAAQLI